jgi:hypothetical protein
MNNKIHDEYATKPRTIKPIFIRATEYLDQLQIDVKRVETIPYYLRPPWRKNRYKQTEQSSSTIRAETAKILEEKYNEQIKINTEGSKKDKNMRGNNSRPKDQKKTTTPKYGLQC